MSEVTLQELFNQVKGNCGGELEAEIGANESSQFHEPGFFDLILWNVIIAFAVSYSSNIAAMFTPRKRTLTTADIQLIRQAAAEKVQVHVLPSIEEISAALFSSLPQAVPPEKRKIVAAHLAKAILDKLKTP